MREYVVIVTFTNGQTLNRSTANQHLAKSLIKMFTKYEQVVNVRMKIVRGKEG